MAVVIRDARSGDIEQLVVMWQALVKETPALKATVRLNRANRAAVSLHFADLIRHGQVLVATCNDTLAGYVAIVANLSPLEQKWTSATVSDLYVQPNHRRSGVGKALCRAAMSFIQTHGLDGATLQVAPSNHAALALYQAFGFTCTAWQMSARFEGSVQ